MSTAGDITGKLGINYETVIASLRTLKKKGKVRENHSRPPQYVVLPKKNIKGNNGQGFIDYFDKIKREYNEVKAENNRLRAELDKCQRELVTLAQRIVRQDIYGNY